LVTLVAAAGAALLHVPTVADANPTVPSIAEPVIKPTARGEETNTAQQVTAEQVNLLIARGDALVSMADVSSARLFYERAAAAATRRQHFDWEPPTIRHSCAARGFVAYGAMKRWPLIGMDVPASWHRRRRKSVDRYSGR